MDEKSLVFAQLMMSKQNVGGWRILAGQRKPLDTTIYIYPQLCMCMYIAYPQITPQQEGGLGYLGLCKKCIERLGKATSGNYVI